MDNAPKVFRWHTCKKSLWYLVASPGVYRVPKVPLQKCLYWNNFDGKFLNYTCKFFPEIKFSIYLKHPCWVLSHRGGMVFFSHAELIIVQLQQGPFEVIRIIHSNRCEWLNLTKENGSIFLNVESITDELKSKSSTAFCAASNLNHIDKWKFWNVINRPGF